VCGPNGVCVCGPNGVYVCVGLMVCVCVRVCVCDLETSTIRRSWSDLRCCATKKIYMAGV